MSKDTESEGTENTGKLADPSKANQPGVEDDRTRILNEAGTEPVTVRDFSPEARDAATRTNTQADTAAIEDEVDGYHKGGGWYELPNGETVQGRDAAIEALGSK